MRFHGVVFLGMSWFLVLAVSFIGFILLLIFSFLLFLFLSFVLVNQWILSLEELDAFCFQIITKYLLIKVLSFTIVLLFILNQPPLKFLPIHYFTNQFQLQNRLTLNLIITDNQYQHFQQLYHPVTFIQIKDTQDQLY